MNERKGFEEALATKWRNVGTSPEVIARTMRRNYRANEYADEIVEAMYEGWRLALSTPSPESAQLGEHGRLASDHQVEACAFAPWWKRQLFKTFLYKKGPCGNFHWFRDERCYCRVGEHCVGLGPWAWNGGVYNFKTGEEEKP